MKYREKIKVYHSQSDDIILLYLGKSSIVGFLRYMVAENHFLNCSRTSEYRKNLVYLGVLWPHNLNMNKQGMQRLRTLG